MNVMIHHSLWLSTDDRFVLPDPAQLDAKPHSAGLSLLVGASREHEKHKTDHRIAATFAK
jgi:hypothetical protein